MHSEQRQRTNDFLKARGLRRALFSHPETITWLTGYAPFVELGYNPFAAGPSLLWAEDGHYTLIVQDTQAPYTFGVEADEDVTLLPIHGYTIEHPIRSFESLRDRLGALLKASRAAGPVGIERDIVSASQLDIFNESLGRPDWVTLDGALKPLRMIKTDEEIAKLRRSFELTDIGYAAAAAAVRPGVREIDVWADVTAAMTRAEGTRLVIGNDCTAGSRQYNIGGVPGDIAIPEGGSIIVDISCVRRSYWSDGCRTFYAGEPTADQKRRHLFIEDALDYAMSLVRPGAIAREIDQKVRAFIERGGYPVYPHHTGHSTGASLHEEPRIVPYNDIPIEAGMVILVEPGTYIYGETGCRLENGMLVKQDGVELLSHFPLRSF
jgi:Xaa-Pro dipeptidase